MGAAYLCAEAGISTVVIDNQAAYVAGWLKKLHDDRKLIVNAAAQAQHAADFILNRTCPSQDARGARAMRGRRWRPQGFCRPREQFSDSTDARIARLTF